MRPLPLGRLLTVQHPDHDVQRRGQVLVTINLLVLGFIGITSVLLRFQPVQRGASLALLAILALVAGSLILAARAHVAAAAVMLLVPLLVGPLAMVLVRGSLVGTLFFLGLSVFISSLVLRPGQVLITGALALGMIGVAALRVPPNPLDGAIYLNLLIGPALLVVLVTLFGFLGARAASHALDASRRSQQEADGARRSLELVNVRLEAEVALRTGELQRALDDLGERAAAQRQLLVEVTAQREVIREMSVPVLPVSAGTLVMPLVGALDSRRLHELQTQALAAVEAARARRLILDITGVPMVDTQVARGIVETIRAVRLLGAEALLVGIRPEVAQTIVGLGLTLEEVRTEATLEAALR